MERMCIPSRYWSAKFDEISDTGNPGMRTSVGAYIFKMEKMVEEGVGFIFFGKNSVGKTCASVVLAKELRRRGNTVLFMEASDLKRQVIEKEHFDEDETYWERAKSVDVLVLDDFGKGIMDSTGFGATLFDELIRARNARKLVTIITSNLAPSEWEKELALKTSTMHSLKECTVPVRASGSDRRKGSAVRLQALLAN
jgi:DNA replication protein DnaC